MKPFHSLRRQSGFTLVELVTVILILGVLAAVALPRYADLQGKARESKVKAVAGSMKAAAALVKAQALATSVSCAAASGTSVTMEGASIDLNHCYPQALGAFTTGILAAANVSAADGWEIPASSGGATAGTAVVIELDGATDQTACKVTYTSPATAVVAVPTIATVTTGC